MAHTDGTVAVVAWSAHPSNLPLVEAWQALGIRAELLAPPEARRRLDAGDTALVRIDVAATFDGVEPGLRDVAALAPRGVRLLNCPAALLAAHDKLRTAQLLLSAGIPHPRTVHCRGAGEIRALAPPFVLKPRFGSWGQDMTLCTTTDDVDACLSTLRGRVWFARHGALIQELVQVSGRDLRILVAGGRVVGALERVAPRGEWRTNEARGAHAAPAQPPEDACALAVAAADALGADFVGVDLLPRPDGGHVVIEVNGAVDFDGTDSLRGRDVYADAADALTLTERSRFRGASNSLSARSDTAATPS